MHKTLNLVRSDKDKIENHYEMNMSKIKQNLEEFQKESDKKQQPQMKLLNTEHLPEIEKNQYPHSLPKSHLNQTLNSVSEISFHTSQNKNLKNPSGRKEVELLDKWLTEMIKKIQHREAEFETKV